MAVIEDVRALGSELERSHEVYVRGRLKFRVKQIVYVAFSLDETIMEFAFPKEERAALVESEPHKFRMPSPSDMRFNWVHTDLFSPGTDRGPRARRRRVAHGRPEEALPRLRPHTSPRPVMKDWQPARANYRSSMSDQWDVSDAELDAMLAEWEAVDRAAADYLAERVPGLRETASEDDARWVGMLAESISPSDEPEEQEIEGVSAVMALQHADWLGLVLGVVRRGPGAVLDPERVQADIDLLEDVEGEIEDREGHLGVLERASCTWLHAGRPSECWTRTTGSGNAVYGGCRRPCTAPGANSAAYPRGGREV